jgi:phosphatidylserine/phosphatidylglycerophosphate/cardiolipin synthase-like enzyme
VETVADFSRPDLDVYFQSARAHVDGRSTAHLIQFIKSAKNTLDCAIYDLKDPDVVDALKSVVGKVALRIAYDGGKEKEVKGGPSADPKPKGTADVIKNAGLSKYATAIHVSGGHLMHSKYIIRDDDTVWTGSGNWTYGGLDLQDNNFLVLSSQKLANAYKANFENLISKSHIHPTRRKKSGSITTHSLSSKQAIDIGNVAITPYFSGDGSEEIENAINSLLTNATKLRVMAMLVSDPGILQAISKFKPQNRDIKGVVDPHEMKQVMSPPRGKPKVPTTLFWFARGDKRFVAAPSHPYSQNDNNDFMHNKVIIIDDRTVVTGSYNFSENAESNDENTLILESKEIADAFTRYFDILFAEYQKHGAPLPPK